MQTDTGNDKEQFPVYKFFTELAVDIGLSKTLYHYTTIDTLTKILEFGQLKMSFIKDMNDSSEFLDGLSFLKNVANQHEDLKGEAKSAFLEYINELEKDPEYATDSIGPFVFSMTAAYDKLDQWRGYGNDGGVAIGLDTIALFNALEPGDLGIPGPCIYPVEKKVSFCEVIIDQYKKLWELDEENREETIRKLIGSIAIAIPFMKNEHFAIEQEWRILGHITSDKDVLKEQLEFTMGSTRKFSMLPSGIFLDNKLPIKEILIGPQKKGVVIKEEWMTELLNHYGYHSVEVNTSKIPYSP